MAHTREEGGKGILPPPRENFTIAGQQFNIRHFLRYWYHGVEISPPVPADKMKPGDSEAIELIDNLHHMQVGLVKYFIAMPRLMEFAAKPEGGFDADFIDVTHYLMKKVMSRRGGMNTVVFANEPQLDKTIKKIAYFSDVYGQMQAVRDIIWRDPAMEDKKSSYYRLQHNTKRDRGLYNGLCSVRGLCVSVSSIACPVPHWQH